MTTTSPAVVGRSPRVTVERGHWTLWALPLTVLALVVAPLGFLAWRAALGGTGALNVLASARTWQLALNTVVLTVAVTLSAAAAGLATAWITERTDLSARRLWATLAALPLVIPSFIGGFVFVSAFGPRGVLADLTGMPNLPSLDGFTGSWLVLTLFTYPYVHLVTAAALRRLDPALEDAARSLGATSWRVFRTVILPQLRPALAAGSLLVSLYTASDFGAVSLMRYEALTRAIYAQYQGRLDRTPAAVLAIVLIGIALVIVWLEGRTRTRAAYFVPRATRPPSLIVLRRRARVASTGFLVVLVSLGLGIPITVLGFWLGRGLARGEPLRLVWQATVGSLTASSLAALGAIVVAAPVAFLVVRHRSRLSTLLERSFYVVYSLPHITIGLAMVFFAANYLPFAYQTLGLLVLTYVAIFLPQVIGSGRAALLQVSPTLEEAARSLGKSRLEALVSITLPLMSRGLVAGGALVFLTAMKELPATLLLRPTGYDTLAVRVWSAANDAFFARAAAPALLLLAVSALPMYVLIKRGYATDT